MFMLMWGCEANTGLLRALHSTILKTFVIRTFFREKWLLTHVLGGSGGQEISCKQACVDFDRLTLVLAYT